MGNCVSEDSVRCREPIVHEDEIATIDESNKSAIPGPGVDEILKIADNIYLGDAPPPVDGHGSGVFLRWQTVVIRPGRVYDGDTITKGTCVAVPVQIDGSIVKPIMRKTGGQNLELEVPVSVRLFGYNSPEIKTPSTIPKEEHEDYKKRAREARDALLGLVSGSGSDLTGVVVSNVVDTYSRLICVLYTSGGKNINRFMLEHGHGEYFDGRHR